MTNPPDDASTDAGDRDAGDVPPAGPIDVDCPCVRCGYNLRGLPEDINCPECGCPVGRTLEMLEARVLCPNCLAPTHPSQPNCQKCGAPLTSAGSVAAYAGGQLHIPARSSSSAPSSPPSLLFVIGFWIVTAIAVVFFVIQVGVAQFVAEGWEINGNSLGGLACTAVFSAIPCLLAILATRSYRRGLRSKTEKVPELEVDDESAVTEPDGEPER